MNLHNLTRIAELISRWSMSSKNPLIRVDCPFVLIQKNFKNIDISPLKIVFLHLFIHAMNNSKPWHSATLILLRFLIGWHFLYEGIYKLAHPEWSSVAFLAESKWIFSGIAEWIISNTTVLNTVDLLNTWGLTAIGFALILGLFTRIAAITGTVLLILYYLFNPPFIGMTGMMPTEGNYLIVDKTLIEAVTLFLIAVSPSAKQYGLDQLIFQKK